MVGRAIVLILELFYLCRWQQPVWQRYNGFTAGIMLSRHGNNRGPCKETRGFLLQLFNHLFFFVSLQPIPKTGRTTLCPETPTTWWGPTVCPCSSTTSEGRTSVHVKVADGGGGHADSTAHLSVWRRPSQFRLLYQNMKARQPRSTRAVL